MRARWMAPVLAFASALALAASPAGAQSVTSSSGLPGAPATNPAANIAAPADTLVRVPGSALRLGWSSERTSVLGSFRLAGGSAGGEVREGEVTWFGSPARVTLTYRTGRLAEVRLAATSASPRLANYVPDDLRRRGYRRVGEVLNSGTSVSEWEGAANIRLTVGEGSVTAEVSPRAAPVATATEPPPALLDFTLEGAMDSLPQPRRTLTPADPVRPQLAVEAGVFGRVLVRARVDVSGTVEHAEIERGIAELNNEALEWAGAVRFEPYLHQGRPAPFVVRIPVAFLPARSAAPASTP
jgi:TonB family protein